MILPLTKKVSVLWYTPFANSATATRLAKREIIASHREIMSGCFVFAMLDYFVI